MADSSVSYNVITGRLQSTNWLQTPLTYTASRNNLVLSVNFKRLDGAAMTSEDYDTLQEIFVMETI